jgi:hypothetical protein
LSFVGEVKLKEEQVWPYVLPFPIDVKQRRMIWGIVQSRVGMTILTRLKLDTRTYQRELIKQTPYSNKSIIEYLKKMTSAGILNQGKEAVKTENKRVWVKWYEPTKLGRWLILFLKNPNEIPSDLARKTIEELFKLYSSSIVVVCEKYGISLDFFHQILDKQARGVKRHK